MGIAYRIRRYRFSRPQCIDESSNINNAEKSNTCSQNKLRKKSDSHISLRFLLFFCAKQTGNFIPRAHADHKGNRLNNRHHRVDNSHGSGSGSAQTGHKKSVCHIVHSHHNHRYHGRNGKTRNQRLYRLFHHLFVFFFFRQNFSHPFLSPATPKAAYPAKHTMNAMAYYAKSFHRSHTLQNCSIP